MNEYEREEAEAKEAQRRELLSIMRARSDLKFILDTEQGRRVFRQILELTNAFGQSFATNPQTGVVDPLMMAYQEGVRFPGITIHQWLASVGPDFIYRVLTESLEIPLEDDAVKKTSHTT